MLLKITKAKSRIIKHLAEVAGDSFKRIKAGTDKSGIDIVLELALRHQLKDDFDEVVDEEIEFYEDLLLSPENINDADEEQISMMMHIVKETDKFNHFPVAKRQLLDWLQEQANSNTIANILLGNE